MEFHVRIKFSELFTYETEYLAGIMIGGCDVWDQTNIFAEPSSWNDITVRREFGVTILIPENGDD